MSYFFDGSSISKYLCQEAEIQRVNEANIQAYSDQVLFGDAIIEVPEDIVLTENYSSEEAFQQAERIRKADKIIVLFLFLLVWAMLIPSLQRIRCLSFSYLFIGLYLIALSAFSGFNGGAIFAELSVPAHATRWLPCIALWYWLFYKQKNEKSILGVVKWMLIIATSLTFATHGYEAFNVHPKFKDLLYGAFEVISIPLSESVSIILLKLIGVMDMFLAIAVIFYHCRWKWLLIWMTIWGGVTAISRPISFGDVGLDDAVLRIVNSAIPLIACFLIAYIKRTQQKLL